MKIIFDEEKAIKEKQKKDKEIPKENKRQKISNAIVVVVVATITIGIFFGLSHFFVHMNEWMAFGYFIAGLGAGFAGMSVFLLADEMCWYMPIFEPKDCYSTSLNYFLATKDKNVLGSQLKLKQSDILGDSYMLTLTLEDHEHTVSEEGVYLSFFRTKTKTNISEIIVDLDERVVYQPYSA